jgi:hypothetical protein
VARLYVGRTGGSLRSLSFPQALILEEVSWWLCFKSPQIGPIDILRIAVQATDKTLRTYLVIDMGMIVRRACPDAFELSHTNADLRET